MIYEEPIINQTFADSHPRRNRVMAHNYMLGGIFFLFQYFSLFFFNLKSMKVNCKSTVDLLAKMISFPGYVHQGNTTINAMLINLGLVHIINYQTINKPGLNNRVF